jgi:hypothetical protein
VNLVSARGSRRDLFGGIGLSEPLPPLLGPQSWATNYLAALGSLTMSSAHVPDVERLTKSALEDQPWEEVFGSQRHSIYFQCG